MTFVGFLYLFSTELLLQVLEGGIGLIAPMGVGALNQELLALQGHREDHILNRVKKRYKVFQHISAKMLARISHINSHLITFKCLDNLLFHIKQINGFNLLIKSKQIVHRK